MEILPSCPDSTAACSLIRQYEADLLARDPALPGQDTESPTSPRGESYFVVAQEDHELVGCGGFAPLDDKRIEIKQMYVAPAHRRQGRSREILRHLEAEIRQRGYKQVVIETGFYQPEAVAFCLSEGYVPISAVGKYAHTGRSRCFGKHLS